MQRKCHYTTKLIKPYNALATKRFHGPRIAISQQINYMLVNVTVPDFTNAVKMN